MKVVITNVFVAKIIPYFAFTIKNNIRGIISINDFINEPFCSIFYFSKPIRLLANSCASKDCKSSIFSPTPTA